MEFVIKIVVTLFIALIVGSTILFFAARIISDAEDRLQNMGVDSSSGAQIIQVSASATAEDILKLADDCSRKGDLGEMCYIIRGSIPELASIDNESLSVGRLSVIVSGTPTAVFVEKADSGNVVISS